MDMQRFERINGKLAEFTFRCAWPLGGALIGILAAPLFSSTKVSADLQTGITIMFMAAISSGAILSRLAIIFEGSRKLKILEASRKLNRIDDTLSILGVARVEFGGGSAKRHFPFEPQAN